MSKDEKLVQYLKAFALGFIAIEMGIALYLLTKIFRILAFFHSYFVNL